MQTAAFSVNQLLEIFVQQIGDLIIENALFANAISNRFLNLNFLGSATKGNQEWYK